MITAERLREVLDYDPETGAFRWRVSRGRCSAGAVAGSVNKIGYVEIGIDGVSYWAHRLAWLYVHGEFPPEQIDHANLIGTDNRIANLRPATNAENGRNRGATSVNGRKLKGVYMHPRAPGRFRAQIVIDGKAKHLGYFDTAEAAHEAYKVAAAELHGEFARSI